MWKFVLFAYCPENSAGQVSLPTKGQIYGKLYELSKCFIDRVAMTNYDPEILVDR